MINLATQTNMMNSSEETCLLCLSTNANMIKFYSETGKELNIMSILSTHFWFQLDEIKVLSQNICRECWNQTESFHEFYQSVRAVHKKFETVFVKIETEQDGADDGEYYQHENIPEFCKIETYQNYQHDQDVEDEDAIHEIPFTNSIDTKAFDTLPEKTQIKYLRSFDKFMVWKSGQNIDEECFSEAVMLEYFYYLSSKYKPSSLLVEYSMLRSTIEKKYNADICYPEVTALLKKSSAGYHSQTSNTFQPDELRKFLSEADNVKYLDVKVVTIFGIYGAARTESLIKVDVNDVSEQGSVFVIKIPDTKTNCIRSFTLENEYAAYVRKYKSLRPENVQHSRFFVNYQNGKCTIQPIGKNKFLNAPKVIAKFLNLKDVDNYTLQSFRKKRSEQKPDIVKASSEPSTTTNSGHTSIDSIPSTSPTTPNKVGEDIQGNAFDLLPEKSREKYMRSYDNLLAWKAGENIDKDCFSEEVMLEYFNHLKTKYKPSSLLVEYSVLRTTIQKHNNIDICNPELTSLVKVNAICFQPQKAIVFEPDEMQRFFYEARDFDYLAMKIIMIFGIYGATRGEKLTMVGVNDVIEQGSVVVLRIPDSKNVIRPFTLDNEYAALVQKYIHLRPENTPHNRFFINYQNGKCSVQPMGKNKILNAPKIIANFLNLKDAEIYTCSSFRKKGPRRRRRGRCASPSDLDTFIEECIPKKRKFNDEQVESSIQTLTETMDTTSTLNKIDKDAKVWELLPGKSREKYVRSYENFFAWKTGKDIDKDFFSEDLMLEYFNHLKPKYKPSSLWVEYSMLRTTIKKNDNVDIGYPKLKTFMKDISVGFQSQKANVFHPDELRQFLSEADDMKYLAVKVVIIFGIYCATSADDLIKVDVKDVTEQGSMITVKLRERKTKSFHSFTVESKYTAYVQQYKKLRPKNTPHSRFFVNYQNGKCTIQPIGVNKIWNTPKVIANYLNLEDAENYTWNSFSKTSKTSDGAGDIITSKWHGRLSSSSIVGSIEESDQMYLKRSPETVVTSTITRSSDTSTASVPSTTPTEFQTYNIQSHQIPPLHYDHKQGILASPMDTSTFSTAFQSYVQPHQVQTYALVQHGQKSTTVVSNVQPHQFQPYQQF